VIVDQSTTIETWAGARLAAGACSSATWQIWTSAAAARCGVVRVSSSVGGSV